MNGQANKSVALALLNYNGVAHLEIVLSTALAAAREYPGRTRVVVVDNRSTADDVAWVREHFPVVDVFVAPRNDYLFSYNDYAQVCDCDVLVLLNNDICIQQGFIAPLERHFNSGDVFAVGATSRDWSDKVFTCGPASLKSHHGNYYWDYARERQELCHTLFCSGGFMAVDRKKFLELGGFNRLFWPGYAEDLDLCFRAWRKGWRCVFEPTSVVLHRENGTWGNGDDSRVARMCLRTGLLFQWATLPAAVPWLERCAFFCLTALRRLLAGQSWWLRVWLATWFEWRKQRKHLEFMSTSSAELTIMLARMAGTVPSPQE